MLNHHQLKLIFGVVAFVIVCVIVWRVFFPSDTPETGVTTTTILPSTTRSPDDSGMGMGVVVGIVISVLVLVVIAWKLGSSYLGKTHKSPLVLPSPLPSSDPPVNTNPKTRLSLGRNSLPPPGGGGAGNDAPPSRPQNPTRAPPSRPSKPTMSGAGDNAPRAPPKTEVRLTGDAKRIAIIAAKSNLDKAKVFFAKEHEHFVDDIVREFSETNIMRNKNALSDIKNWLENEGADNDSNTRRVHKFLLGAIRDAHDAREQNNK